MLSFNKCELFVNFMIDYVNRFITQESVAGHLTEMFESERYRSAARLNGLDRREFLLDLYKRQLTDHCRFRYVASFEMIHESGHTGNYLVYGTRNLSGLRAMKAAMWSVDPASGVQFSDRLHGQEVLFSGSRVDLDPLKIELLEHFQGRTVSVDEIEEYVLAATPYSASHWNRGVLSPLERDGQVEVVRTTRQKRFTFPPGTVVRFT
jgi:hypothetical protein